MNNEQIFIEGFLKNLCDKEYSKANSCLKQIVNEKIKAKIKASLMKKGKKDKKDKETDK